MFAGGNKDFITAVDEKNIIIVKEIKDKDTYEDLEKTAQVIVDMLNTEAMGTCTCGVWNDYQGYHGSFKIL